MAVNARYSSKAEIPAGLELHYAERDGAFFLDCPELAEHRARLDEFRGNNIALKAQLEKFEGLDPEAVRAAVEAKRKLDEGELLKKGDIDAVLQPRLAPILKRATEAEGRLSELLVNQGAIAAASKRGLRATAIPDLTLRARGAFKVVDGKAIAVGADGAPKVSKDGVTPLSFDEWAEGLVVEAPHLFEMNSGGGAAGGLASGHISGVKNPWRKETWNLTEQMKLLRSDPVRAAQFKNAAGVN